MNNRRIKQSEIAMELGISKEWVHNIIHEHLHMKKICARWIPRILTVYQRLQLVEASAK